MMLIEQTTVPETALPIAELRDHLRLGTGFADDAIQDQVLEMFLRAAVAAIEARTGKVLITKDYSWTLTCWREPGRQPLPLAPVVSLISVVLTDRAGLETVLDLSGFQLEQDMHRPRLLVPGGSLPRVSQGGRVGIEFTAGFGPVWGDMPADLAQAVFMLAAYYYENRAAQGTEPGMPSAVTGLIERYRNVRIFGGGVR